MKKWIGSFILIGMFAMLCFTIETNATMEGLGIEDQDWSQLDQFLSEEFQIQGETITFTKLATMLIKGEGKEVVIYLLKHIQNYLFAEISQGMKITMHLLALGLVGAIFANFSDIFSSNQISETGFFMTYLIAFVVLAAGFGESIQVVVGVLEKQLVFMQTLIPSYFLTVAWSGGSLTSAAWYEFLLFLIMLIQFLYLNFLVPMTRVYLLLAMASHMAKENMLSHMTEFLRTIITWGTKSLMGLVVGFQLIQGMVLPYADSIQITGMDKLLQVIPGVGQGASAVVKVMLGSGVLIKNTMGAVAAISLVAISLVPLMKLWVVLLLYRLVVALMEPVSDKRLVAFVSSVTDGQQLLVGFVVSTLLLFLIALALICLGTNVSYLA